MAAETSVVKGGGGDKTRWERAGYLAAHAAGALLRAVLRHVPSLAAIVANDHLRALLRQMAQLVAVVARPGLPPASTLALAPAAFRTGACPVSRLAAGVAFAHGGRGGRSSGWTKAGGGSLDALHSFARHWGE